MQEPGAWAIPLTDAICRDAELTGGKAASLALLRADDLPVPPAYVLPVAVFCAHLPEARPDHRPERPSLAPELVTTLSRIAAELCPDGERKLVVRSSALGEDGESASFAGQNATYYYVDAESLPKAIVDCWLSLWSEPALAYRRTNAPDAAFGMAVIVQQMIQSERSGVCFSEDPTGERSDHALLESSWGLGAALVDGRVSPDRFWVSPDGLISQRKISRKRLKVAEDLRDPTDTRLEPIPLRQQTQPSLSEIEVGQIAALTRSIAQRRGAPQDVEWAIDGDELFVLQSRPITTTPLEHAPSEDGAVEGRWVLFKPTAENFQEPMTPMTVDLFRRVIPPFGRFIHGRFYVNADLADRLLPWSLGDEALADVLLMRGTPAEATADWRRLLGLGAILSAGYLLNGVTWHRTARVPLQSLASFEPLCEMVLAEEDLDPLESLRQLVLNDHPFRPIGEFPIQCNISSVRYFVLIEVLNRLLARMAPDYDRTNLSLVLSGGSAMLSRQMVEGIRELAEIAHTDTALAAAMGKPDSDLQAATLAAGEHHPFNIALEAFLTRFGHRAVREIELMTPRWREDNNSVLSLVRSFFGRQTTGPHTDPHGLLLAAEDELHQALPRRWQRRLTDHLIDRIRYYVTLRENTRHYHTMAMAVIRVKLKGLEQRLLQTGRLKCEDDLFFLEYAQAVDLDRGELEWQDVEPVIRRRRLAYQDQCLTRPPETFNIQTRIPLLKPEGDLLVGDCASPGVATGTARIIRDPSVASELRAGDILVAPYTDPAWTPLFPGTAAIIVEVGSYLSHAGTVAREYGVPCLVDVHGCMDRIRTGAQLKVNATEGWVEIVS